MKKLIQQIAITLALVLGTAGVANAGALSAPRATKSKNAGPVKNYLMKASTTIYAGGLVMIDSNGVALPAGASASNHGCVGVAIETKTSAASGSYYIQAQEGWFLFAGTTLSQANVGNLVYGEDDQTVDDAAGANEPVAGMLVEYVSASSGWVHVSSIYMVRNAVSDPLTLTGDFTGGGGAGAITLTDSASSIVIPNNDSTALDIGGSGLTNLMRFDTTTNLQNVQVIGGFAPAAGSAITTDTALDSSDCGKSFPVTAAFDTHTITLPALSATPTGCSFRFFYTGADAGALLDISPNAADGIEGGCTLAASVVNFNGTDDNDVGLTKATIQKGDTITVTNTGDVDDWYASAIQGICANN